MKKIILTLGIVLALVMALVIPASVAMAAESDTSSGSGTVAPPVEPSTIDVTAPGDFAFGVFTVGDNFLVATDGAVVIVEGTDGATGYTVTAMDQNQGLDAGKMLSGDLTPLNAELLVSDDDGGTYSVASTGLTYTGGLGGGAISFDVNQVIDGTDLAGDYTITIEFAGSLLF